MQETAAAENNVGHIPPARRVTVYMTAAATPWIRFHARICHRQLLTHFKSLRYPITNSSLENDFPGRHVSHDRGRAKLINWLCKESSVTRKLPICSVYMLEQTYMVGHMIRVYDDAERRFIYQNVQFFIVRNTGIWTTNHATFKFSWYNFTETALHWKYRL